MPKKAIEEDEFPTINLGSVKPISFVSSGVPELDSVTGGFPRGRVTEIAGVEGVGKTSLMAMTISKLSEQSRVFYVDAESAFDPKRVEYFSGVIENIDITNEYLLEKVAQKTLDAIGKYDIIVIDSIAALVPLAEASTEIGAHNIGLRARLMGQWMRKLIAPLGKSDTAFLLINQVRYSMEMYGQKFTTPGGKAVPYAASLRLQLSTTAKDKIPIKGGGYSGHWVTAKVTKSRVCAPHQEFKFKIRY